ncbi:GspE/PulE family protein [Jannaschia pohangensis]|uniref:GspE/PulE family protein n=1 Tax=Jannaschia pohangensis TaxID=390807 RepID=UPI001587E314|nr:GspE/PulE family protein [Jannaschia pohangensis]
MIDHLVAEGVISSMDGRRALSAVSGGTSSVATTIMELGLADERPLFVALAEFVSVPFDDLHESDTTLPDVLALDLTFLKRVAVVPLSKDEDGITMATSDPGAADVLEAIAFKLDETIMPVLATPSSIAAALARVGGGTSVESDSEADLDRLKAMASDGPVVRLVNDLIGKATADGASDVHIEAEENGAEVRFRIDGTLRRETRLTSTMRAAVVSRLKIMAQLNISEKRRPQDGRASVVVRGRPIDLRLSTLPIQHGESVVLRILDQRRLQLDWSALGYSPSRIEEIRKLISVPNGIVLVAGPTGSGKTTTLYTALAELNKSDRKIITVEDPVEYLLKGIVQVQVEPEIDMSFARALRAILRQDPNIVMIGEIRDEETAEIAVRAAQMGRLVLSTVHTNNAVAAVDRLLDLGVAPYLLASTLRGVLSQRLVSKLCSSCGGKGCVACGELGRLGRTVVSEMFRMSDTLADAITAGNSGARLMRLAVENGHRTLREEGRALIDAGVVDPAETHQQLGLESAYHSSADHISDDCG